jgi:hypothetical protein
MSKTKGGYEIIFNYLEHYETVKKILTMNYMFQFLL